MLLIDLFGVLKLFTRTISSYIVLGEALGLMLGLLLGLTEGE